MTRIAETVAWRGLAMLARIQEARTALQHQALYGENNEVLLQRFLRERLPSQWNVGSGELIDMNGIRSPQCDIIVYDGTHFPPAFESDGGKVVVLAHAVGAIVEVKSSLNSGTATDPSAPGDAQALAQQLTSIRRFLSEAMKSPPPDPAMPSWPEEALGDRCPLAYGFSYRSTIQEPAIAQGLASGFDAHSYQVFCLDVPRPASVTKQRVDDMVKGGNVADIVAFTDWYRMPNGFNFTHSCYNQKDGRVVWQVDPLEVPQGSLNSLVKEMMDQVPLMSPIGADLSSRQREYVYSRYHKWAGLYGQ